MGALPADFRARTIAVAVVVSGHLALLALLSWRDETGPGVPADERMALVFIDLPEAPVAALPASRARVSRAERETEALAIPEAPAPPADSAAITPGVDWYSQGSQAAVRAAGEPATRRFDFPKREPAPRAKKEFGWDKTHTERVHSLDGGGIGVHLSDNCELILAPLPFAGCALGKRRARDDLFDEMKAPPEMGDWKEK